MDNILLDTDVVLDFFFDRKPFSEDAAQILTMCENKLITGYVTAVALSNIYYILRKTAKHEKVIDNLKRLLDIIDVATTDRSAVLDALYSEFNDFEDALQNFSAQHSNDIRIVITRNTKDYKTSTLSIMTPETYLKTIK